MGFMLAAFVSLVIFSTLSRAALGELRPPEEYQLRVEWVDPALMSRYLTALYGPEFIMGDDTRMIIFSGMSVSPDSVFSSLRHFDQEGVFTLSYPVRYLSVEDAKELISKQFAPKILIGDKVNNSLLIMAPGDSHLQIALLLQQLDREYNSYRDEIATGDPPLRTRIFWLKHMAAARAQDYIREHYIKIHRTFSVSTDTDKNAVIVSAAPRILDLVSNVLKEIDIEDTKGFAMEQTEVFPVYYHPLSEAIRIIKAHYRPSILEQSDSNRTLIITAATPQLDKIREFLSTYDAEPPTIIVEGTILSVRHSKARRLGTEVTSTITRSDGTPPPRRDRTTRENLSMDLLANDLPNLQYQWTTAGGKVFTASLGTLITEGAAEIVLKPHITFLSGGEGTFEQNENIPQLTVSQNGTNVSFIRTGLVLKVSGIAVAEGEAAEDGSRPYKIILDRLQLKDGRRGDQVASAGAGNIAFFSTEVLFESPQIVEDGELILIGGAVNEDRTTNFSRIPILGSIPIIKNLFRSEQSDLGKTERLALLRISVVKPKRNDKIREAYEYKAAQFVISKPLRPIELGGKVNDSIFEHPLKTSDWSSEILYRPGGGYFEEIHEKFTPEKLALIEKAFKGRIRSRIKVVQEWSNMELLKQLIDHDGGLAAEMDKLAKEQGITVKQLLIVARHQGTIPDAVYLMYIDFARRHNLVSAPFIQAPLIRESKPMPEEPTFLQ